MSLERTAGSWTGVVRSLAVTAAGCLAPLGFVLGMPLPLGLRCLRRRRPALLPWAWGINGACSVLGSIVAVVLALHLGFRSAHMAGMACYALAGLAAWRAFRSSPDGASETSRR